MAPTPEQQSEVDRLAGELSGLGFVLPGTLTRRLMRCGRPNCHCHAEPPVLHGPYEQWTRKVAAKTVTRFFSAEMAEDYRPWLDNCKRLRALVARLEALGIEVAEADPRWQRR
jgi:hypothetical protein